MEYGNLSAHYVEPIFLGLSDGAQVNTKDGANHPLGRCFSSKLRTCSNASVSSLHVEPSEHTVGGHFAFVCCCCLRLLIAAGLAPFAPETQAVRASELLLSRIRELVAARATFSFETTLAARSYHTSIVEWRRVGYRVVLYFIWLRSAEMAIERVAGRVQQGGHYIPEDAVRRRYERGMRNLFELYAPIDSNVYVFDGTAFPPILVAEIEGENSRVLDYTRWEVIVRQRTDASHD